MVAGEHIFLRALEPSDVDMLYDWENDMDSWFVSNTLVPFSKHTLARYIEAVEDIHTSRQLRLMICLNSDKQAIGCIDLFDFDPVHQRAGIGILVAQQDARGKGYAQEALTALVGYAWKHLRLHQLYCNISAENEASLHLFQKQGFQTVGTKKDWLQGPRGWQDELLLQLIR